MAYDDDDELPALFASEHKVAGAVPDMNVMGGKMFSVIPIGVE